MIAELDNFIQFLFAAKCHLLGFIHHTHLLSENITLETQEYELHVKCITCENVYYKNPLKMTAYGIYIQQIMV